MLRQAHVILALISVAGFCLRWFWRMSGSPLGTARVTKVLPHVVDTAFLVTGVVLAIGLPPYPGLATWLTAKISGLVLYILCGIVAMRSAPRLLLSSLAFITALVAFAWVVSVARTRLAAGFLAGLISI